MSALVDLTGQRFGKLVVIKRAPSKNRNASWECLCDCGNTSIVQAPNLKSGGSRSCGCELIKATIKRNYKHGGSYSKLYMVWIGMKERCNNPNNKQYDDYGGRGINICKSWTEDFSIFQKWAFENGYKEGLSIERINNNEGYNPRNCKWATKLEQNRNRRPRRWAKKPV